MRPWDLLVAAGYVLAICIFALGVIGIIAQVRFEVEKRRGHQKLDRVIKERQRP